MQSDAERTLNNLNILSALSQNDKLLTNEDTFDIHAPTTMRAIWRFWSGERRVNNIQRVRTCVRNATEFIAKSLEEVNALEKTTAAHASACATTTVPTTTLSHPPSSPPPSPEEVRHDSSTMRLRVDTIAMQHFRMLEALKKAQRGISNLLQTYRDDPALASQVQLLIDEITDFVSVIDPHSSLMKSRFSSTSEPVETTRRIPTL